MARTPLVVDPKSTVGGLTLQAVRPGGSSVYSRCTGRLPGSADTGGGSSMNSNVVGQADLERPPHRHGGFIVIHLAGTCPPRFNTSTFCSLLPPPSPPPRTKPHDGDLILARHATGGVPIKLMDHSYHINIYTVHSVP